jgi:hypothetical protein
MRHGGHLRRVATLANRLLIRHAALVSLAALTFCLTMILVPDQLVARDDGRFANSPLKPWFDGLASGKGLCCRNASASLIANPRNE